MSAGGDWGQGTGWGNPVVGGTVLRRAAIASPNFVTGSAGWSINQNGTAEFNSLTIRNGTIISGVFLLYSSATPAKGNLVVAFAPITGGTDSVGNVYPQGYNYGVWDNTGTLKQHFGIDSMGRLYIAGPDGVTRIQINNGSAGTGPDIRFFNDFGAVILVVDPSRGGTFQYLDNNSAVQGVLIGAQVGKNTTDPINGTAVSAGVNLIDPAFGDSLTAVGATIKLIQAAFSVNAIMTANTGSGATSPFLSFAGPEQSQAGHAVLRVYGTSVDGTVPAGVIISTTDPPVRALSALLEVQGSIQTTSLNAIIASGNLQSALGDVIASAGNVLINTAGKGLRVKEGSNAKQGTATLAAGSALVVNSAVTAVSRIFLTSQVDGGAPGFLRVSARTAGTSFTITSSSGTDTSTVAWEIFEPA